MKLNVLLAVAALTGATALSAQTVQKLDDEKYALSVQDLSMTVDAAHGGKILSFKLGEQEILAQNPAAAPQPEQAEGQPPRRRWFNPNSYGSTFWTSPQKEWNWPPVPEYDSLRSWMSPSRPFSWRVRYPSTATASAKPSPWTRRTSPSSSPIPSSMNPARRAKSPPGRFPAFRTAVSSSSTRNRKA